MKITYLDNAATTFPKPDEVYRFMDDYYRKNGFNMSRGKYGVKFANGDIIYETKDLLKGLFQCNREYEVAFTSSATEALNLVIQGLCTCETNNVYITPFEHNAVLRTLYRMAEKYNFQIRFLDFDREKRKYLIDDIKNNFIINRPDILIMTHASNAYGFITPIGELAKLAKINKAKVVIDAAQTAGLLNIDMSENMFDALVFAGHKTLYGPFGIAGIVYRKTMDFKPLLYGGVGIDSANHYMPENSPKRYEAGSNNILAISGLNRSLKWIKEIGRDNILKHEIEMKNLLLQLLEEHDEVKVFSSENDQIGVVSFIIDGFSSDEVEKILVERGIAVRSGLHCAPVAHRTMNNFPEGTVRLSLGYFNNADELELLNDVINELVLI